MANQPEQTTTQEQSAPATGLTLQDLVLVVQIIQLGSQRGAFRAEEFQQVGELYTRLITFLKSTGVISEANPEENKND